MNPTRVLVFLLGCAVSCAAASTPPAATSTIAEIKSLSPRDAALARTVRLQGVVTLSFGGRSGFFLQDDTGAVFIRPLKGVPLFVRQGDWVECRGETAAGQFAPIVNLRHVEYLGRQPIPAPVPIALADFASGRSDSEWVETRGVIRTFRSPPGANPELQIAAGRERLRVDICDVRGAPPPNLIGSEVRLRGAAGGYFNQDRQMLVPVLFVPDWSHVELTHPASGDPFTAALRSTTSLFRYAPAERAGRMCKLRGVVTHHLPGKALFLRDADGPIYIESTQLTPLAIGDVIEVAGFPALGTGAAYLQDAIYRVTGSAAPPAPMPTDAAEIAQGRVRPGELIALAGVLGDVTRARTGWTLTLKAREHTFDVFLAAAPDTSADTTAGPLPEPGSELNVRGILWTEGIDPKGRQIVPSSFRVLLRSATDVDVLQRASWWTRGRLVRIVVTLLVVVLAALVWIWLLRRRVAAQTSTIAEKVAREAVADERARTACEIHDTVAQGFMALGFQLEALSAELPDPPPRVRQHLDRTMKMLRHSHEEVRHSLKHMRGQSTGAKPLGAALRESIEQGLPSLAPAELEFVEHGAPFPLPPVAEHNILRIGQEAAANAARHSGARRLVVELSHGPDRLRLRIADDGRGFAFDPARPSSAGEHFGLQIMQERARRIGARLEIRTHPGAGAEITLEVPRPRRNLAGVSQSRTAPVT